VIVPEAEYAPISRAIRRCLTTADPATWTELVQVLQPVFARVAYRVLAEWGRVQDASEIDDILQEIFLKLAANGAATLERVPADERVAYCYLRTVAANRTRDYLRAKYADKDGLDQTVSLDAMVETFAPTAEGDVEREILLRQIDAALRAERRERTIFWLYYGQGLTAKEIASLPGCQLGAKGVESLIYRLAAEVKKSLCDKSGPKDFLKERPASESS
jgi:RNA polymerase sigma-70 factor (ECF subfamily)